MGETKPTPSGSCARCIRTARCWSAERSTRRELPAQRRFRSKRSSRWSRSDPPRSAASRVNETRGEQLLKQVFVVARAAAVRVVREDILVVIGTLRQRDVLRDTRSTNLVHEALAQRRLDLVRHLAARIESGEHVTALDPLLQHVF